MLSHTCPCGLKTDIDHHTVVWIRSPKTGRTLDFNERCQSGLPDGVKSRIVQAAAKGILAAEFTADELAAMVELYRQWKEATTPRRGGASFQKASRSMSARY